MLRCESWLQQMWQVVGWTLMTSPMSSTMTSLKTWRSMCTGLHHCHMCSMPDLTFVHRIGRTGRAGKRGTSISLWERRDWRKAGELVSEDNFRIIFGNNLKLSLETLRRSRSWRRQVKMCQTGSEGRRIGSLNTRYKWALTEGVFASSYLHLWNIYSKL